MQILANPSGTYKIQTFTPESAQDPRKIRASVSVRSGGGLWSLSSPSAGRSLQILRNLCEPLQIRASPHKSLQIVGNPCKSLRILANPSQSSLLTQAWLGHLRSGAVFAQGAGNFAQGAVAQAWPCHMLVSQHQGHVFKP